MNAPLTIREISASEVEGKTFTVVRKSREELHGNGEQLPGQYITDGVRLDMSLVLSGMTPTGENGNTHAHTHIVGGPVDSIKIGAKGEYRIYTKNGLYEMTPVKKELAA